MKYKYFPSELMVIKNVLNFFEKHLFKRPTMLKKKLFKEHYFLEKYLLVACDFGVTLTLKKNIIIKTKKRRVNKGNSWQYL